MARSVYRTVFISDVHLGSPRCRVGHLDSFLAACECRSLYVVGDLVDAWGATGTAHWPAGHADVLAHFDRMASEGTRLYYLPGNHDRRYRAAWRRRHPRQAVARALEHATADGRRFLVLHGDRFDALERRAPWVVRAGELAAGLLGTVGRWLPARRRERGAGARNLRQLAKRLCGYTGRFERRAARHARRRDLDGVICGHVHAPGERSIGGIQYYNDGDWVESCTALVEHDDGRLELLRWRRAAA